MKKVFVALSGGVDSSVVAHRLLTEGWDVTAVFIRVWQPEFLPCSQDDEERAAMRVAAFLGIPFKRLDLSEEYKRDVVDTMIAEYTKGRTPNPDVLCNASIKFGAFLAFAKSHGADKIATGHHAQVRETGAGIFELLRGADPLKDQAYFLWQLTQEELAYTLMPIGNLTKAQVRSYAEKHKLPSARKADSQGLCFIGDVDMKTFLKHFITTKPGDVLDTNGIVIGAHDGAELVTIGQRGGFTVTKKGASDVALYVVSKDTENNTITVAPRGSVSVYAHSTVPLVSTNWMHTPEGNRSYTCEIRYHGTPMPCTVVLGNSQTAEIHFTDPIAVAPGQSVVVYDNLRCMGGGIVA